MLQIKNLHVDFEQKKILKGAELFLGKNQTHFVMGPNGAGKSTLGLAVMGHPNYKIKKGRIFFQKKDIKSLSPDKRARKGIFLAFQQSAEFEGVKLFNFLRVCLTKFSDKPPSPFLFRKAMKNNLKKLRLKEDFFSRYLNFGFSGGEKKKSEILHLLSIKPKLAILDEIDSGLDIDSLKIVAKAILRLKKASKTSFLVITHQSRLSHFLKPDLVHIMIDGAIVKSGSKNLISKVEKYGYENI